MDQKNQNSQQYDSAKLKLVQHLQNRQKIRSILEDKGIQTLNKKQLLLSDIQEKKLNSDQNNIYNTMKSELSEKGFSDFRYLGQGAQGLVVLAKEQSSNRRYAIKGVHIRDTQGVLDQETYDQVQKEIKMLNQCRGCPYVVNLIDQTEGKEYLYLILAECQGTLKEIIQQTQNEKLNELSAIKYAKDIAEGLYFIHQKKCLVNDLKLDNILIDYNGNAIVSDFGLADNLPKQSGYALGPYMGNLACQAPECYDSTKFNTYFNEYSKLGVSVNMMPSERSEACSLGYLIYIMISGEDFNLILNKHNPLSYKPDFQNFVYKKQLQYIIDGLTQFIPRKRLDIKEVLIILKGIISFEFQLDSKFLEVIDDQDLAVQQYISSFQKEIEIIQDFQSKFYPIVKNEKNLVQLLNQEINQKKQQQEQKDAVIEELSQTTKRLEELIKDLSKQIGLFNNQQQNIQPVIQNYQANNQVISNQTNMKHNFSSQNYQLGQQTDEKEEVQSQNQNQMQQQISQQHNLLSNKQLSLIC